jgi:arylsulfate sulfotransferase
MDLIFGSKPHLLVSAFWLTLWVLPANATITATPMISPASTQPVYTPVTITFGANDTGPGPVNYSLAVAPPGGTFQLIHDFNLEPSFVWAQNLVEGAYQLQITARDNTSGEQNSVIIPYTITSRITKGAVVTATSHPLVALFSAPACPAGSTMQVVFYPEGKTNLASATDSRPCVTGSMNFLIGGLYPNMPYLMNYLVTTNGVTKDGPKAIPFTTGAIPSGTNIIKSFLKEAPSTATALADKILLTGCSLAYLPYATDLVGNPLWYYGGSEPIDEVDRLLPGGTLLVVGGGPNSSTGSGLWGLQTYFQVMREIDLVGNTVRETNVDRVNEQLPLGAAVTDFNHEVIQLPNGHILAIASNQQIFPAGTQGNSAPISIIGDVIVDLDTNLQVAWYWNAFDHDSGSGQLSISRPATLGETCSYNAKGIAQLGCPPVLLTSPSNDWLHGNSLQYQSDGSILMSLRHQDWLIDIDYANGTGAGDIFWRMGLDGDFTMLTTGQYPWFSHQHDAEFTLGGETSLTVLDNGDVRIKEYGGHSRGMVLNVDIPNMTVSNAVAQDLGVYSLAEGSAQLLANGDYMFLAADVPYKSGVVELSNEYTTGGTMTYSEGALTGAYRAFRVPNLYSAPNGAGVNVVP